MEKVEAANKVAVESGHRLLSLLGQPQDEEVVSRNLIAQTNESLYKFKKVVSLLDINRFAAAKARRMKTLTIPNLPKCLFLESYPNPTQNPSTQITHNIFDEIDTRLSLKPPQTHRHFHHQQEKMKSEGPTHTVSSTVSSLSLEGSVTGQNNQDLGRRRCTLNDENGSLKCVSAGKCHCSKKRFKRSIKVPAISNKMADIPTDEFVWRKYGQKPIKGSPHPRAYYKCSTVRGCPARKHVERCAEEPSMMLVNYEGEHVHPRYITIEALPIMGHQPGTNC